MQIKDFMTSSVVAVRDDTPLKEAARLLVSHGYNVLPVLDDDGSFLGAISEADLTIRKIVGRRWRGSGRQRPGGLRAITKLTSLRSRCNRRGRHRRA
jgi:CBS-domain-containing membrane protein